MTEKTSASGEKHTRRQAVTVMGTAAAGIAGATLPASAAPETVLHMPVPTPVQVPRGDLVNVLEYETQARLVLGPTKVAPVLGSDRTITDRITLRPRMNIPTRDLDLSSKILGDAHFTPI